MRRTVRVLVFAGLLFVIAAAAIAHPTSGPMTDPIPRIIALL